MEAAPSAAHPPLDFVRRNALPFLSSSAALTVATFILALLWAPTLSQGFSAPVAQRVFYLHFGPAITSYAAFTVAFAYSLLYLRKGDGDADLIAAHSAALGLLFAAMTIAAGALWGAAEWGVAWRFEDARLDMYLVLLLTFIGYFALRRQLGSGAPRLAALYAVAGYALVPLSYFSIYLWQSLHPRVISPGGQGVGAGGALVLSVSIAASLFLFFGLLGLRLAVSEVEARVARLQREADV